MNEQPNQSVSQSARPPDLPPVKKSYRWLFGVLIVSLIFATFLAVSSLVIVDEKVVMYQGLTTDIEDHIEVQGAQFYPSPGEIRLVSVRTKFQASVLDVLLGWLDGSARVRDRSEVLGTQTPEQNRQRGLASMTSSSEVAVRVALDHLGYDVISPTGVRIEFVHDDAPADGMLFAGDVVLAINETPTLTVIDLVTVIRQLEPGTEIQLTVQSFQATDTAEPIAELRTETITLGDSEGQPVLGVQISTINDSLELPFEVDVNLGSIGGPSAGLAMCLSVIDYLGEDELTQGLDVIATGTMSLDGSVGRVGSVDLKAHAVLARGADLMLVPTTQIEEARSVLGDYIEVVGVGSLQDALQVLADKTQHRRR